MRLLNPLCLSKKALVNWIVFMALVSPLATASTDKNYLVHTGPNGYPPFIFVDKRARETVYSGIIVDLLDAFEQNYPEFSREYNSMTRTRANSHIERGVFFDLMFHSKDFVSPKTREAYRFTEPLFVSKDIVVTRQDSELEYLKPDDLHGKSIATLRGYSYWEFNDLFAKNVINSVPVDLHTQAIGMLDKKRVDAYFGNIHVTPFYLKQIGLDSESFKFSNSALSEVTYAFMVHRDKSELFTALNTFVKQAKKNGDLQAILDLYLK